MNAFDDAELRALFSCFGTPEPSAGLIRETKEQMRRELVQVIAPAATGSWVLVLAGLAVAMSLCLFYMFTVGTLLQLVVPVWMVYYLQKSLLVFTALGGTVIAGAVMAMILKLAPKPRTASGMRLAYSVAAHESRHVR